MALTGQNFVMHKGDDKILTFTITDATDVTGFSATWNMAVDAFSTKLLTKTSGGGGITFSGNKVLVTLDSANTKDSVTAIPEGNYYHELSLIDGSGKKNIAAIGIVDMKKSLIGRP